MFTLHAILLCFCAHLLGNYEIWCLNAKKQHNNHGDAKNEEERDLSLILAITFSMWRLSIDDQLRKISWMGRKQRFWFQHTWIFAPSIPFWARMHCIFEVGALVFFLRRKLNVLRQSHRSKGLAARAPSWLCDIKNECNQFVLSLQNWMWSNEVTSRPA